MSKFKEDIKRLEIVEADMGEKRNRRQMSKVQ